MGWARGTDGNGRNVGYEIVAICDQPGCIALIDRGLAYRCGPLDCECDTAVPGCGGHFCGDHLFHAHYPRFVPGGGFCRRCADALGPEDDEDG